jgi:PST family polysaccharide transporter
MLIQLASQVVLARLLLPADFGVLAMVSPLIALVCVLNDIGLGQAIVQKPVLIKDQVSALFWVSLALGFGLAFAAALSAPLVAWIYGDQDVVALVIVLAILIPISGVSINPTALLSRQMRFGLLAFNEAAGSLAGAAVAIACAWQGFSYWSLVAGQFATCIIGTALAWANCGWLPSRPRFGSLTRADLKIGANITGANLATFITTSADNVIVGLTTGQVALGLYDRSYRLVVGPLGQLAAPIGRIAVPLLSRLAEWPAAYRSAYLKMLRAVLLVTVPGMLVCITSSKQIILFLLGSRWSEAVPIFSWICVGGLTTGIYASANWLFISQARTRELRDFTIYAAIINIASFLIGGCLWGIVGVAAAGATGFVLVTTPLMIYGATRSGPVRARDLLGSASSFTLVSAIVYVVLVAAAPYIADGLSQIVVAAIVSYGFFAGLVLRSAADRHLVRELLGGLLPILRRR